jgi:LmbE family N-acetylglucosaminyl deacetylase
MRQEGTGLALFLLAHQDDEIAFSPLIARFFEQGRPMRVVYLTDGAAGGTTPARRARESERALAALGVPASAIRFLGTTLSIPDGGLFRHLAEVYGALAGHCRDLQDFGDLYTMAWEGGHPDHDAAHVLAMKLAIELGLADRTWQVPFYRAADRGPPFFKLFAPLQTNGPARALPAARQDALLRAAAIRFYPSQWRTFLGLGPGILWHALIGTPTKVQQVQVRRSLERPTAATLLYEKRNGIRFAEFVRHANRFLTERGEPSK